MSVLKGLSQQAMTSYVSTRMEAASQDLVDAFGNDLTQLLTANTGGEPALPCTSVSR